MHKPKDRANYSLNWQKDFSVQGTENQIVYAGEHSKVHETTKYVANLLNFKWELKKAFTAKQRLELLHSLSFTERLIESHLGKQSNAAPEHAHFAPRTPAKFFDYLSSKNPSSLYCQEYLEFFSRKADQKNKIMTFSKLYFTKIKEIYTAYQQSCCI